MKIDEMEIRSDPDRTRQRLDALDQYFQSEVFHGEKFVCKCCSKCTESHPKHFFKGQLHHVGTHYDLRANGRPFRIAIIGQEDGSSWEFQTLEDRRCRIRKSAANGFAKRNPHMRGTTSALRLIFGREPDTDTGGEFLSIGGQRVHLFECFVLINFLLCSALAAAPGSERPRHGAARGNSTPVMRANCATHLRKALQVLEPNLIIAQGVGVSKWMAAAGMGTSTKESEEIEFGAGRALMLKFSHPAARFPLNWGTSASTPYLLETVKPTIRSAVARLLQ